MKNENAPIYDLNTPDGSYIIDLTAKRPKARKLTPSILERALKRNGDAETFKDLIGDYDTPVFYSEADASEFLTVYLEKLDSLDNKTICKSRDFPALIYKRHYMIQTLMGLKNQTYRERNKAWAPGTMINLYDQVYFLSVRIRSIKRTSWGWKYSFELP